MTAASVVEYCRVYFSSDVERAPEDIRLPLSPSFAFSFLFFFFFFFGHNPGIYMNFLYLMLFIYNLPSSLFTAYLIFILFILFYISYFLIF